MKRKRDTEEQMISILKEHEPVVCRPELLCETEVLAVLPCFHPGQG
mgnify:CR=1 FL=1